MFLLSNAKCDNAKFELRYISHLCNMRMIYKWKFKSLKIQGRSEMWDIKVESNSSDVT